MKALLFIQSYSIWSLVYPFPYLIAVFVAVVDTFPNLLVACSFDYNLKPSFLLVIVFVVIILPFLLQIDTVSSLASYVPVHLQIHYNFKSNSHCARKYMHPPELSSEHTYHQMYSLGIKMQYNLHFVVLIGFLHG